MPWGHIGPNIMAAAPDDFGRLEKKGADLGPGDKKWPTMRERENFYRPRGQMAGHWSNALQVTALL